MSTCEKLSWKSQDSIDRKTSLMGLSVDMISLLIPKEGGSVSECEGKQADDRGQTKP